MDESENALEKMGRRILWRQGLKRCYDVDVLYHLECALPEVEHGRKSGDWEDKSSAIYGYAWKERAPSSRDTSCERSFMCWIAEGRDHNHAPCAYPALLLVTELESYSGTASESGIETINSLC